MSDPGKVLPNRLYVVEVVDGNEPGKTFTIDKPYVTLGRKDCDIVLMDPEVSRRHAALTIDGETATLQDLGSANGTYVEGLRVEREVLQDGSQFRMGTHQLLFRISEKKAGEP